MEDLPGSWVPSQPDSPLQQGLTVRRFTDLLTYTNRIRRKAHYAATATESFALYLQESLRVGLLTAPAGKSLDEFMLDEFKGHLRRQIRHGWTEVFKCVNEIIDEVGCRSPIPSPYVDKEFFRQDLLTKLCGVASACGLKRYLGRNRHDFNALHVHLEQLKQVDEETLKRIHAIEELCRDAESDFKGHQCYRLADAIIVHEAPLRCRLISSNRRHIEPICNFLNRPADFYR